MPDDHWSSGGDDRGRLFNFVLLEEDDFLEDLDPQGSYAERGAW